MATANPGNVAALISTLSFPEMTDLINREFVWNNENYPRNARQLFMEDNIPMGTGDTRRYKETDGEKFARYKGQGAAASKSAVAMGYEVDMVSKRIARNAEITFEMRQFGKDREIVSQITSLSEFCPNRLELDLTHRFTFCTSTTYTDMDGNTVDIAVGDGLQWAYSTHTLAASSTTYSNRVTGDPQFSKGAYQAALLLGATQTYTNFGELIPFEPNTIICYNDPVTLDEINKLFKSSADVDGANSGVVNTYSGNKIRTVVLHYLATSATGAYDSTKRRWWSLAQIDKSARGVQAHLGIFEASNLKVPASGNNGEDINTDNWTYGTRMSYGIAILSGRKIVFSCPTS
jgi:hypothetical protein